jgi:uncharacterized protein YkwD
MQQPGSFRRGDPLIRAAAACLVTLLLAGCASEVPVEAPSMYTDMATSGARLDAAAAAIMISQYRQNNGLGNVEVDPELMRLAEAQSQAMADKNKLDHDVRAPLAKRLTGAGYQAAPVRPPHKANMLKSGVTKIGIAASYAPNTKYKVFWTMILAAPDGKQPS